MYKKLILAAASASFALVAEAAGQPNPATVKAAAPAQVDIQADAEPQTDDQRNATKAKAAKRTQASEQPITELEPVIVTAPLQTKLSEAAAPVTVLSDEELTMKWAIVSARP